MEDKKCTGTLFGNACRFPTPYSATSIYIAPDTYDPDYVSCKPNKSKTPFLSNSRRKVSWVNPQQVRNPAPNVYKPEKYIKHRVKGGQTPSNIDPRFAKPPQNVYGETGPGPGSYGPCTSPPIEPKPRFPIPPCGDVNCPGGPECFCRRSTGVLRKAPLRGPCDNNVPSIPKKGSKGYYQPYPCGPWCPVPTMQPSLYPSPEFYDIRKTACYCTDQYKGNFWSRMRGVRRLLVRDGPGPAYYEGIETYEWNALYPLKKQYEKFREFRRFNACKKRYPQMLIDKLEKENFPSPAHYYIQDKDCCPIMTGVPFPPFLQGSQRAEMITNLDEPGPADYQWYIIDCFDESRKVTSRIEPPFRSTTERFQREWCTPGPGDYKTPKGIGDKDSCSHKDWSVLCPFGSSTARATSYLMEDPCHPSPARYFKFSRNKKRRVTHANYKSVTERFPECTKCGPDVTTYNVGPAKLKNLGRCEHLHAQSYCRAPFLNGEERFKRVCDWPEKGYDHSFPGPTDYEIVVNSVGNPKLGTIGISKAKCKCTCGPGPNHYYIHPQYLESRVYNTFNAKLCNPLPREISKPPREPYPHRVAARKKLRCFAERICPLVC